MRRVIAAVGAATFAALTLGCTVVPPVPSGTTTTWQLSSLVQQSEVPFSQVGHVNLFGAPEHAGQTIHARWTCAGTTYPSGSATLAMVNPFAPYSLAQIPIPTAVLTQTRTWVRANCSVAETHQALPVHGGALLRNSETAYAVNLFHHWAN